MKSLKTNPQEDNWSLESWKHKAIRQQATYPDQVHLDQALSTLSSLPPLVTSWEVKRLKNYLAEVSRGERFLVQGGDCAESST